MSKGQSMDEQLAQQLQDCKSLPSLPTVAARVVETINGNDFGLTDIADIVQHDIAISTKLIATANSAAYKRGKGSSDVNHAISRLGGKATLMIALSFSLANSVRNSGAKGIDDDALWKRSAVSASIARLLAQQLGVANIEECFLAALVQDIGVLALNRAVPATYDHLVDGGHQEALEAELSGLDCDHAEVGRWLLEQWDFPPCVTKLVASSHEFAALSLDPTSKEDQWSVAASGVLADALLSGDEMALARALSLIENLCASMADGCDGLRHSLVATVADAEALFEASLVPDAHALMESSKVLLFEHVMANPGALDDGRIEELEERVSSLEQENRLDALTGAHNRAHFDRELERLFEDAQANGESISLMFIDADHFKRINDSYGHTAGDEILKWLAKTLQELVRGTDVVGRYGGEEFVVILPTLSEDNATAFGERICERLRSGVVNVDDIEIGVTVSIGIACAGTDSAISSTRELVFAADQAMYFAKQSGRDLCVGASRLPVVNQLALTAA